MAAYFHGGGAPETLYLMNPGYVSYADTAPAQQTTNMMLLNSLTSPIPHPQQHQQQQFVGVPIVPQDPNLWAPVQSPSANGLSLSLYRADATFDEGKAPVTAAAVSSSSTHGLQSLLMGSKYLKAAQQLLDEVVNVGGSEMMSMVKPTSSKGKESPKLDQAGESANVPELSTAERQELQMKKAKLVTMFDEVEHRYRQYHHQMQIVVSSFEAVAGFGAARTYTALALKTISKQFRCLKDAISSQIKAASKSLGEEDGAVGGSRSMGSRLRFVDHQLRQQRAQRALQQLGMMQHNTWRPQRGLPERAVSVLRAWLFEHFLHP